MDEYGDYSMNENRLRIRRKFDDCKHHVAPNSHKKRRNEWLRDKFGWNWKDTKCLVVKFDCHFIVRCFYMFYERTNETERKVQCSTNASIHSTVICAQCCIQKERSFFETNRKTVIDWEEKANWWKKAPERLNIMTSDVGSHWRW